MYKISDVSNILGVAGYKIIELMVNERDKLKDHIKFVQGVRQIDEDGINLIRNLLGSDISQEISNHFEKTSTDVSDGRTDYEEENEIVNDTSVEEVIEAINLEGKNEPIKVKERKEELEENLEEDILGKYKKEIYLLDQEIRRLDYAITSYFDIISEDMSWLSDEEKNVIEKYKVLSEIINEDSSKGLFKGIFRR